MCEITINRKSNAKGNRHTPKNGFCAGHHMTRNEDGVLSPEDSDLAQLRSLNEGELTADWYNFQVRVEPKKIQINLGYIRVR